MLTIKGLDTALAAKRLHVPETKLGPLVVAMTGIWPRRIHTIKPMDQRQFNEVTKMLLRVTEEKEAEAGGGWCPLPKGGRFLFTDDVVKMGW